MNDLPPGLRAVSGDDVLEILWPMNDMFRARLPNIRKLPYDPSFEEEADRIIVAWSKNESMEGSDGAWRVLLERHQQLLVIAMANKVQNNPVTVMPEGLSAQEQLVGLALLLLLRMKLPFPPRDVSGLTVPAGPPRPDWKPN